MLSVSSQFKTAIGATSRTTHGKVIFQVVDVDAAEDATVTVTGEEAELSKKDQITNTVLEKAGKLATLETDYWLLDGSFVIPPTASESGYEVGWWSDELSGVAGVFAVAQVVTLQFTMDHTSIGLTIFFDVLTNEYAADFVIVAYDSLDAVIHTETVVANTDAKYTLEQTLSNFRKVIVTITKWGAADRRARISEISLGVVYEYTGAELIKVNILEELDTTSNQVSSNEVKFTIENADRRFNILNPTGFYPALQKLQKVNPLIGVEVTAADTEYAQMGVYYLTEWASEEGGLTATFTARDILDVLAQDDYAGDTYVVETLYDIAEEIIIAAGVTDYEIDTALQAITTSGSLAVMKYRDALQQIAIAGMAVVYSDRTGKLIIKQLPGTVLTETIDFDNMYKSPLIKLDKLVNTVYVKSGATTYTYTDPLKPADEQTMAVTIESTLFSDAALAENTSAWLITEYRKRFLYEINWRTNPALECGDIVTVEDDFSEDKTARITKQEFEFAGYLTGRSSGRGGGV